VEISLPYKAFSQEGWGTPVDFDKNKVIQVSFQTLSQPHKSVELKVFDFSFVPSAK
jgi:hypothetical protein